MQNLQIWRASYIFIEKHLYIGGPTQFKPSGVRGSTGEATPECGDLGSHLGILPTTCIFPAVVKVAVINIFQSCNKNSYIYTHI